MKVKHKQSGVELTVNDEAATSDLYWKTEGGSYIHKQDQEWELVKAEEWEDVTDAFHATANWPSERRSKSNGIANSDSCNMFWVPCEDHNHAGYRLRKIDGMHNGPAFIIERRKA
jgi:hypothetical protein